VVVALELAVIVAVALAMAVTGDTCSGERQCAHQQAWNHPSFLHVGRPPAVSLA
jgi:hypothetical protein